MPYTNKYYPKRPVNPVTTGLPRLNRGLRSGLPGNGVKSFRDLEVYQKLLAVYLEQYRDIKNKTIEPEFFEEQIKNLLTVRMKILHLQRSWQKFTPLEVRRRNTSATSNGVNQRIC